MSSSSSSDNEDSILVQSFTDTEVEEYTASITFENSSSPQIMEIIDYINRRLVRSNIDYPVFLEIILSKLCKLTESKFGCLLMKEDDCLKRIVSEDKHNIFQSDCKELEQITSLINFSLTENKVIISNDISKDPRIEKGFTEQISSIILIPVKGEWVFLFARLLDSKKYVVNEVESLLSIIKIVNRILKLALDNGITSQKSKTPDSQSKFLASMSHDLRTPLNGIMGIACLLSDTEPLTKKQKEYIKNIQECTFQMATLINNFLDFNKIISDKLVLENSPFTIDKPILDALTIVRGNAINKGLDLDCKYPQDTPVLLGDKTRLTQILSNLLGNAVKFTDKGSIFLDVKCKKIKNTSKWNIMFKIKDTGIGIPKEEQERIFEFFRQSPSLNTFLNKSGSGFGLSFSKELIKRMNGDITVHSTYKKGSVFKFYVILEEDLYSIKRFGSLKKIRVIAVDDRAEIRAQLTNILFKWGCLPVVLPSSQEVLQYLEFDSNFRVALIDICMPNMGGQELAQELRRKYFHINLIGLSSAKLGNNSSYFDYYMYKPIEENELYKYISLCLKNKKSNKGKPREKIKILIAEDNTLNAYTLKEMLVNLKFKSRNITIVENGKMCVDEAKKNSYDVILMDIIMPIMDGLEASKIILKFENRPLIVATSAAVLNSDKAKCQKIGIDGYIEKPISKDRLNASLTPLISSTKKKHKKDRTRSSLRKYEH